MKILESPLELGLYYASYDDFHPDISTRLQPADRGGAAPGAGLHVQPRPRCFSLVSGKVMT